MTQQQQAPALSSRSSRETGILFSGPMVRGVKDGTKTQTRRTRGLDAVNAEPDQWALDGRVLHSTEPKYVGSFVFQRVDTGETRHVRCPYGQPGDLLWVRETWKRVYGAENSAPDEYVTYYRADPPWGEDSYERGWKPSIHMPRYESRLTLEITEVRVERVQDISEADAQAEGVAGRFDDWAGPGVRTYRKPFRDLWDSLNTARGYSFESNPWVWVLEFRRLP